MARDRLYIELAADITGLRRGLNDGAREVEQFGRRTAAARQQAERAAQQASAAQSRLAEATRAEARATQAANAARQQAAASQNRLTQLRRSGTASADALARADRDVAAAERRVQQAQERSRGAARGSARAQQELAEARRRSGAATAAAARAEREAADASRDVERANSRSARAFGALGTAAAAGGLAVAAGLAVAVTEALEFDKAMRNVNSISGMSEETLKATGDELVNLSRTLPQSATTLAEGLYDVASSGFAGADGMTVLNAAAVAASAGMTDTAVSAKAITAVLNAYKKPAAEAADVSDVLFSTVKLGVITFEQLSNNVGDYIGTAQALGVSFEESGAAIATMTLNGINAAQSGTALNGVLSKLITPSEALAAVFAKQGYASGQAAVEALGFSGVMNMLGEVTGGSASELQKLFPDIEALRGALALTSNGGENFNKIVGEMVPQSARAGAAQEALAEQSKAAAYQLNLLKNNAVALGLNIGRELMIPLANAAKAVNELASGTGDGAGALDRLSPILERVGDAGSSAWEALKNLGEAFGPIAAGIGGVALGAAAEGVGALAAVLQVLGGALQAVTGFIADHEAVAYALFLTVGLTTGAFEALALAMSLTAVRGVLTAYYAVTGALRGVTGAAVAARAAMIAATFGVALIVGGVISAYTSYKNEVKATREEVERLRNTDVTKPEGIEEARRRIRQLRDDLIEQTRVAAESGEVNGSQWTEAQRQIAAYDADLAHLDGRQQTHRTNIEQLGRAYGISADEALALAQATGLDLNTTSYAQLASAVDGIKDAELAAATAAGGMGTALNAAGQQVVLTEQQAKELEEELGRIATAMASFGTPLSAYQDALGDAETAARDLAEKTAEATTSGKDSWEDYAREASVSLDSFTAKLEEQVENQKNWRRNLAIVAQRAGTDVANILMDMGKDGVDLVAKFANGTDREVKRAAKALIANTEAGGTGMQKALKDGLDIVAVIGKRGAKMTVDEIAQQVNKSPADVAAAMAAVGVKVKGGTDAAARKGREGGKKTADAIVAGLRTGLGSTSTTAADYANRLAAGLNPILKALGKRRIAGVNGRGGMTEFADGGVREQHTAQIAQAGEMRLWAEPETGGEAYIPLAKSKDKRSRSIWEQVGEMQGWGPTVPFAAGGFWNPANVPKPPSVAPVNGGLARPATATMGKGYDEARAFAQDQAEKSGVGGSASGLLPIMAAARAYVQQTYGINNIGGFAQRNIAGTNIPSDHSMGKAIDVMTSNRALGWAIANDFAFGQAHDRFRAENVIWQQSISSNGGGFRGMSDRGSPTQNHYDHVHIDTYADGGIRDGSALRPWVRDQGGPLLPGYTYNGTGGAEMVVPPREAAKLNRLTASGLRKAMGDPEDDAFNPKAERDYLRARKANIDATREATRTERDLQRAWGAKRVDLRLVQELEDRLDRQRQRAVTTTTRLETAEGTLQGQRDQAAAYASQVKEAASGGLDIVGREGPKGKAATGRQITGGVVADLGRVRRFAGYISKLRKRGLSDEFLGQLLSAGPAEGFSAAKALAEGSDRNIRRLNRAGRQLNDAATGVGVAAGLGRYGGKGTAGNPYIRDMGGPLLPGYTLNMTGKPETVVPGYQMPVRRGELALAAAGGSSRVDNSRRIDVGGITLVGSRATPRQLAEELAWLQ